MNENQTNQKVVRPTKKQKQLLDFISQFIAEKGYSPSYREIMAGLNYTSVATVALHVNNLIKRGLLTKRDNSARSLEVVNDSAPVKVTSNAVSPAQEKWLIEKVEHAFREVESLGAELKETSLENLFVLNDALRVLGLEAAAQSFVPRLNSLKSQLKS